MLKDATRRRFQILLAWDVSRLGRSLRELVDCFETLRRTGVDLYLDQQGVDTTTPAGRALFGMAGVFAEFERSMLIERTRAGLDRARAEGKRLGRPITPDEVTSRVHDLRLAGLGMDRIARELGIGKSVAQRICQAMSS
jgi:DNA invertase Pin-like site-specific DNA recombinase